MAYDRFCLPAQSPLSVTAKTASVSGARTMCIANASGKVIAPFTVEHNTAGHPRRTNRQRPDAGLPMRPPYPRRLRSLPRAASVAGKPHLATFGRCWPGQPGLDAGAGRAPSRDLRPIRPSGRQRQCR
jgi:hypothetical protein